MDDELSRQTRTILNIDPAANAIDHVGTWTTWGRLGELVDALVAHYDAAGLEHGVAASCALRNRPSGVAMIVAAACHGSVVATVNPMVRDDKLLADIRALRSPVVVADPEDWARPGFREAVIETQALGLSVGTDGVAVEVARASVRPDVTERHPGVLVYMLTSGTTGTPRRVPMGRRALAETVRSSLEHEGGAAGGPPRLQSAARLLTTSLVHMGGLWEVFAAVLTGRPISIMDRFNVADWRAALARHQPKVCLVAPAGLRMILDADIPREELSCLVALRSGSAPLEVPVIDAFEERYGLPVLQTYGATEFSGVVAGWSLGDWKRFGATRKGSVGRIYPTISARIVDPETGAELPRGQVGLFEIDLAGNGDWLRTTDLAELDEENFLTLHGRADNAIIRGGFKVLPDEVARVLMEHPAVRDACIVGLPDRRLGAVPAAAIVTMSGHEAPTVGELTDWVRGRMAPYNVPVRFLFVDDIPRSPSLKPAIALVREMFVEDAAG